MRISLETFTLARSRQARLLVHVRCELAPPCRYLMLVEYTLKDENEKNHYDQASDPPVAARAAAVDHRNEGRGELERRLISVNGQRDATGGARLWRRRRTGVFVPVAAGILPARFFKEGALDVLRDAVTGGGAPAAEAAVRVVLALAARAHRRAVALLARTLMPKKALVTFA